MARLAISGARPFDRIGMDKRKFYGYDIDAVENTYASRVAYTV
jgi:hypothetical protein